MASTMAWQILDDYEDFANECATASHEWLWEALACHVGHEQDNNGDRFKFADGSKIEVVGDVFRVV